MKLLPLLGGAALLGAACGGNVTVGSGGASSTSSGAGGSSGDAVDCSGSGASKFPTFDKTCSTKSDCVIELHQVDCCGTETAIGVSKSDASRFDEDEKLCEGMYPGCECAEAPTTAEDGKNAVMGKIEVACQSGRCMTFVP